jgi:hypothetical protein
MDDYGDLFGGTYEPVDYSSSNWVPTPWDTPQTYDGLSLTPVDWSQTTPEQEGVGVGSFGDYSYDEVLGSMFAPESNANQSTLSKIGSFLGDNWKGLLATGVAGFDAYNRYDQQNDKSAQDALTANSTILGNDFRNYSGMTSGASDQTTKARDNVLVEDYMARQALRDEVQRSILEKDGVNTGGLSAIMKQLNPGYADRTSRVAGYENNFNQYADDLLGVRDVQGNYDRLKFAQPQIQTIAPTSPVQTENPFASLLSGIPEDVDPALSSAYMSYLNSFGQG